MITTCHSSIETSRPFQFLYSQILQTSEQNSMAWDEIKFVWNWSHSQSFPTSSRICGFLSVGEYKELDLSYHTNSVKFSNFPWRLILHLVYQSCWYLLFACSHVGEYSRPRCSPHLICSPTWWGAPKRLLGQGSSLGLGKHFVFDLTSLSFTQISDLLMKNVSLTWYAPEKIQLVLILKILCSRNWAFCKS